MRSWSSPLPHHLYAHRFISPREFTFVPKRVYIGQRKFLTSPLFATVYFDTAAASEINPNCLLRRSVTRVHIAVLRIKSLESYGVSDFNCVFNIHPAVDRLQVPSSRNHISILAHFARDNARDRRWYVGSSREFPRNFRESNGTVAVNPGWILASGCRQYSTSDRVRARTAPHQCTQRHGSFYGI